MQLGSIAFGDPPYKPRRALHTGAELLADRQKARLADLFTHERHVPVDITWSVYQQMISAYRDPTARPEKPP